MSDVKDRLYRAKCRARQILISDGWNVEFLTGTVFDIEASDAYLLRKIKICLDTVSDSEINQVRRAELPDTCRREMWLKISSVKDFKVIKIKPLSIREQPRTR